MLDTCWICKSTESPCGMIPLNSITRKVLDEIWNVTTKDDSRSCFDCLMLIDKAVRYRQKFEGATDETQSKDETKTEIEVEHERSVSLEPGSCESDDDAQVESEPIARESDNSMSNNGKITSVDLGRNKRFREEEEIERMTEVKRGRSVSLEPGSCESDDEAETKVDVKRGRSVSLEPGSCESDDEAEAKVDVKRGRSVSLEPGSCESDDEAEAKVDVKRGRSMSLEPGSCESDDDWPVANEPATHENGNSMSNNEEIACVEPGSNEIFSEVDEDEDSMSTNEKIPCDDPKCKKKFTEEIFMKLHYSRAHTKKPKTSRVRTKKPKTVPLWYCNCCNKTISIYYAYHYKTVHADLTEEQKEKLHTECNVCGKKYATKTGLHGHKRKEHPELTKEIPRKKERMYEPKFIKGKGWICCDRTYATRDKLLSHKSKYHPSVVTKEFQCQICDKIVPHIQKHYQEEHYKGLDPTEKKKLASKCNICGQQFTTSSTLYIHRRAQHSNEIQKSPEKEYAPKFIKGKGWSCCGKIFENGTKLADHRKYRHRSVMQEQMLMCHLCNKFFKNQAELKTHNASEHKGISAEEKKKLRLKCNICGKKYTSSQGVLLHKRSYHPELFPKETKKEAEKKFEPKFKEGEGWRCCGKLYATRTSLNSHKVKKHPSSVKPKTCICWICNERLKTGSDLQMHHKLVHGNLSASKKDKISHSCTICKKKFPNRGMVLTHRRREHSNIYMTGPEKKFAPKFIKGKGWRCCGKLFLTKTSLSTHKSKDHKSAIQQKLSMCHFCSKLFKNNARLSVHQAIEHKDLSAKQRQKLNTKCTECGSKFNDVSTLLYHKRAKHPELFNKKKSNVKLY